MGNKPSFPLDTPLGCLLIHWKGCQLDRLKRKELIRYCTQDWPMYPLGDGEKWPPSGSLGLSTILQLGLYCKLEGKEDEIPYVPAFMALYQDHKKRRKYKLRDADKCLFNVLLAKAGMEDPLDVLLIPPKGVLTRAHSQALEGSPWQQSPSNTGYLKNKSNRKIITWNYFRGNTKSNRYIILNKKEISNILGN